MTRRQYFGTDGVRGPVGGPLINPGFAARLAEGAARWARSSGASEGSAALIGRDTRTSGPGLERAIAEGLSAGGLRPVSLGVLPTPAVSMAVRDRGAALGVVITASHNPSCDNGIKFFKAGGAKLRDEEEALIEQAMPAKAPASGPGDRIDRADALAAYMEAAQRLLPSDALRGWRIVVDAAHGATATTTPGLLRRLGAEVSCLGIAPDGQNINSGVGSEHPGPMCALVRSLGARVGIAHDGDGDRCVAADEAGSLVDGDELLVILALHAKRRGLLQNDTLVVTQQSNLGLDRCLQDAGIRVCRTAIGDRYVIEGMRREGASLGGENSGHVICTRLSPTGDGLAAALLLMEAMIDTGRPLSELRRSLSRYPQATRALKVAEKIPLEQLPRLSAEVAAVEQSFGSQGRVLVRYSGTESKLRLLVEGPAESLVSAALERLSAAARAELRVL